MAWIAPDRGVLNVWVAPVGRMEEAAVVTDATSSTSRIGAGTRTGASTP
jgi:hypothetical protein